MTRIEKLLAEMTLAEKLGQLTMTASSYAVTGPVIAGDSTESIKDGSIGNLLNMVGPGPTREMQRLAVEQTRLGIPLLIGLDVIHGHRTLFPTNLGEAALFDTQLWELTAREAAREAACDGIAMTFAPMLDVSRDPRWGRTAEGPGEDAWVGGAIARAKVRGFQGPDLAAADSLAAVAKHFCAYGPVTAGRDYASVDISERTLREVHLPAFEAAVRAGVAAIMPAFTDLAGIPMTAHIPLLRDYLRGELGFDGVLVSDYNAIAELMRHGIAADLVEAAALALNAGVDIDMMANAYRTGLPTALERGLVSMQQIDTSVRRVLRLKEQLGLFDDPYLRGTRQESESDLKRRRALARTVGARSVVLLKNERGALPLSPSIRRLALLGPLAHSPIDMRGPWFAAGPPEDPVTVLTGVRQGMPGVEVLHASGVDIESTDTSGIGAAIALCEQADAIVLCIGESAAMSGEAACRVHLDLPGQQRTLVEAVLNSAGGKPVIAIVFSGRALVLSWLAARADALLAAWFPGSEAGNALCDLLTGRASPSGRTPITWPRSLGQIPIFFGQRPSGRPENPADHYTSKYLDSVNEPLYCFGHGLSYGQFRYSNLRVDPGSADASGVFTVTIEVANVGEHAAEETVFLFTRDTLASVSRPLLELKGFTRLALRPGEMGTATLTLPASELSFLGADLTSVFEPGQIEILVGPKADRQQLLSTTVQLRPR